MKRRHPITDTQLSVNMPRSLATALAIAAEKRATSVAGYIRAAALDQLERDGIPLHGGRTSKLGGVSPAAASLP
jgi:hypothetical protein